MFFPHKSHEGMETVRGERGNIWRQFQYLKSSSEIVPVPPHRLVEISEKKWFAF